MVGLRRYEDNPAVKNLIRSAVKVILKTHKVTKIYLFGSYLKGYYADYEGAPDEIQALRKKLNKPLISDIDFMVDIDIKQKLILVFGGKTYQIDVIPLSGNEEKLLIWDGNFQN